MPGSLTLAYADPERIEQVLVNLVHNAIKLTDPGGSITASRGPAGYLVRVTLLMVRGCSGLRPLWRVRW